MTTALPDWSESTVRVLRLMGKAPRTSARCSADLLTRALVKNKYLYASMVDERKFSETAWRRSLEQVASEWTEQHHNRLIKYLDAGGYTAPDSKGSKAPVHSEKILIPTAHGFEELEMELDESDIEEVEIAASITSGKKSQLSPKHEMQEILDAAEKQFDPRYGAW